MGFLSKLFSKRFSSNSPQQSTTPLPENSTETHGITLTFSYSGPTQPEVIVSEAEVAEVVKGYNFVLSNELELLKTADQWFEEKTQLRRLRDGSEKAYRWLLPFLPLEVAKLYELIDILYYGPNSATEISKALRKLIRERRKTKQPFGNLLQALYNSCILADFSESLAFEGMPVHLIASYVDFRELKGIKIKYSSMGYKLIKALSKTDVKWLVEVFGEPADHMSFDAVYPNIRRNAVSRYCWEELRSKNRAARSLGLVEKTMDEWLHELVKRNLRSHKEWLARNTAHEEKNADMAVVIQNAWAATQTPFAVADLETTGLRADNAEILEMAALLVEPDGSVTSEFSVLIKTDRTIPDIITQITGITQAEVDACGQPIFHALAAFLNYLGERHVFFHNAPFDQGFLNAACAKTGIKFNNIVHDTLPMARCAWPSLNSYKLGALAKHVGAVAPKHRALGDAHVILAVLLAARAGVS